MKERRAYLSALQDADPRAATSAMQAALLRGASPEQWIRQVVAPVQRAVGEWWFDGTWSIADEHAATGVAEQAISVLRPFEPSTAGAPYVVFACAEGELHSFPARLAAELAGTTGVRAAVLGTGVPAADLSRRLAARRPDVLALSCTMPTNLIGAWRSITAAHDLGVPVVVGGRAWGDSALRSRALGADALLQDPVELATARVELVATPVTLPPEALLLEVPDGQVLLLALERQTAASPWMQAMPAARRQSTLNDLSWLARHAAAAVATDDATIVAGLLDWLVALLRPRGVPVDALLDSPLYLADAVEPHAPRAAAVLRAEADAARTRYAA